MDNFDFYIKRYLRNEPDTMYFSDFRENVYFHENLAKTFKENFRKIALFLRQCGTRGGVCEGGCGTIGDIPLIELKNVPEKI